MIARVEDVAGEGIGLVGGEDKHLLVAWMVGYLDALGMVEVHGMREVCAVGDDAICGSRTLLERPVQLPKSMRRHARRSKGLVMRNYIRIGVPSKEARGTEIPTQRYKKNTASSYRALCALRRMPA